MVGIAFAKDFPVVEFGCDLGWGTEVKAEAGGERFLALISCSEEEHNARARLICL
jgi:hypothetical protein